MADRQDGKTGQYLTKHKCPVPVLSGSGTWLIKESDSILEIPRLRKIDGKYWMAYHSYPGEDMKTGLQKSGLPGAMTRNCFTDLLATLTAATPISLPFFMKRADYII